MQSAKREPMQQWHGRLALAAALCLLAATPGNASAKTGFDAPRPLSAAGQFADSPVADVGANGRTLIAWRQFSPGPSWRIRLGRMPNRLGRTRQLSGTSDVDIVRVAVGPDGSAVACWVDRRHRLRCSSTGPTGRRLGRPRTVTRWPARARGSLSALVVDDEARAVIATRSRRRSGDYELSWSVGRVGRIPVPQRFASAPSTVHPQLAAGLNGSVIATWSVPADPKDPDSALRAQVAVLAPGTDRFGPPTDPAGGAATLYPHADTSATAALITYRPYDFARSRAGLPIARTIDTAGALEDPVPVLGPGNANRDVSAVAIGPRGDALVASTEVRYANDDCGGATSGKLFAGPIGTANPQQISVSRQIVLDAQLATLQNDTTIAVWRDQAQPSGRMEYSLRPPGALRFGLARALPVPVATYAYSTYALASGGNHAVLVWQAGRVGGNTRIVATPLQTDLDRLPRTDRPRRPYAICD